MNPSGPDTRHSPRLRRLWSDYMNLRELVSLGDLIEMAPAGDPPDRYRFRYRCKTLAPPEKRGSPRIIQSSVYDIYLHRDYPQKPPMAIWRTPIFHPNILPPERGGTVCFGGWSPGETLADLVLRIGEMIQYKNYDLDDALNLQAVKWVRKHRGQFPIDDSNLAPGY